jgi:hypothetical protein
MSRSLALLSALALATSLVAAGRPNRIEVPRTGRAPIVDGRIGADEWKGATHIALSDNQTEALLLSDGSYLYVGIRGLKPGIGSVCVQGKTGVRVLHASAALGTAAFELEAGKWRMTRGFNWSNRDTSKSPAAMADRKNMLTTSGWFANTSPTAIMQREYQVPIRGKEQISLAVGYYTFTPEMQKFGYWPANLEDDCADGELASGFTDREYSFDPSKWGVVVLK